MDTKETNSTLAIDRRDFLKAAGIGAAAMAMPGFMMNASAATLSSLEQEIVTTDVLVIGGGIAGTFAAVKAKQNGADVTIIDKGTVGRSGLSPFFGAYGFFQKSGNVSRDNFKAGVAKNALYLNRPDYVEMVMDDSEAIKDEFLSWGAGEEAAGGHGASYRKQIQNNDIRLIERTMVTELFKKDGKIAGAIGFSLDEEKAVIIKAKAVVLCSGSGAFKTHGFPVASLTHDGDAMAYRIGAEITGKEFVDFHWTHWENPADVYGNWQENGELFHALKPSAFGVPHQTPGAADMATQAHNGNVPFMMGGPGGGARPNGPPMGEGASPGEGSGARPEGKPAGDMPSQGESGGPPGGKPPGVRSMDLPIVWGSTAGMASHKCEGIFPSDDKCSSSVPGLFAAGDALFTGGAAYSGGVGSSSSGSAVQGANAGEYAATYAKANKLPVLNSTELEQAKERLFLPRTSDKGYSPIWVTQVLQGIMIPYYVLNIKHSKRLEAALANIEFLREHYADNMIATDAHQLRQAHETRNMLLNAEMKLRAGLMRTESRGDHYREDYPDMDDKNWLAWIIITQDGESMKLSKRDIPDEWKPKSA